MVTTGFRSPRRLVTAGAAGLTFALVVAACGGSASPAASTAASTPSPSVAASPSPSPSPSPTPSPSLSPTPASSVSASGGIDAAAGLKIGAPYTLTEVPSAAKTQLETQMASSLAIFGNNLQVGFRLVTGGTSIANILVVMAFPQGTLTDAAYQGAVGGMTSSLKAKLSESTEGGVKVSSGTYEGGTVALFHVGDHLFFVVSAQAQDALPIAKALISAN